MKLKLIDGKTVEGTPEEISNFLNTGKNITRVEIGKYGNKTIYHSESKGYIPIANMNLFHIKNAICRIYREWVAELYKLEPVEVVKSLEMGLTDETFLSLTDALVRGLDNDS